jgi:hypothetical protein
MDGVALAVFISEAPFCLQPLIVCLSLFGFDAIRKRNEGCGTLSLACAVLVRNIATHQYIILAPRHYRSFLVDIGALISIL